MPIYEFECECGKRFEELTKYKSKAICPRCGKKAKRIWSGRVGLKFVGTGFYTTDYKK